MPRFDVDVDVDEFMDKLSQSEIKEVIEWLEDNDEDYTFVDHSKLNFDESMLLQNLDKIKSNLIQVTKEEMEIINQIAKRL